jgi:hypothetical protein
MGVLQNSQPWSEIRKGMSALDLPRDEPPPVRIVLDNMKETTVVQQDNRSKITLPDRCFLRFDRWFSIFDGAFNSLSIVERHRPLEEISEI